MSAEKSSEQILIEKRVVEWWNDPEDNYRGERAELRRCRTITEVIFTPGYHRLRNKLLGTKWHNNEGLAIVAGILAHVKNDEKSIKFVESMARPKEIGGDKARVSGLRFRRLLKCEDYDDRFIHLIRIVNLLDKKVHITDLANNIYWWNERTRKEWAFTYYKIAPANTD